MHSRHSLHWPSPCPSSPTLCSVFGFPCPCVSTRANTAKRQCAETCGSTCYSQDDINAAVQQGYGYYEDGTTVGNDAYPHQYEDYEGFSFADPGPYYEFPILSDEEVYTGGSPGADRVIFTGDGTYEGVITHTGASGNDFLQCTAD
ncbi:guanyl-specific ribonuclease T1 [Usnea florida]